MRVIIQRVCEAQVVIQGVTQGAIQEGYVLLVGFCETDTRQVVEKIAHKIIKLRIFEDEDGKMNQSIHDVNGSILSVSQFTLYANCKKGNRPSFQQAAKSEIAIDLYKYFNQRLKEQVSKIETGVFGADMQVSLINDGPVTIVLDSEEF